MIMVLSGKWSKVNQLGSVSRLRFLSIVFFLIGSLTVEERKSNTDFGVSYFPR